MQLRIIYSILYIFIVLFFYSCSTVKDAFDPQRKNSSEEFLVEKKSPLSMPPDFEKLPEPKANQNSEIKEESNNVEELIKGTQNQNNKSNVSVESSSNLEESIIEKIKNN